MCGSKRWNLRRVFRLPSTRARRRAEVDAELAFHLEGRVEELMARGLTRDEAEREAHRRFGDVASIERDLERVSQRAERRRTVGDHLEALAADLRFAARSLTREPIFTAGVVLTLTLGIGATASI